MSTPTVPAIPAQRPAPYTDLDALSKALDHLSSAGYTAPRGEGREFTGRLCCLARDAAVRAFPAGSREADAFAVILGVLGGTP